MGKAYTVVTELSCSELKSAAQDRTKWRHHSQNLSSHLRQRTEEELLDIIIFHTDVFIVLLYFVVDTDTTVLTAIF